MSIVGALSVITGTAAQFVLMIIFFQGKGAGWYGMVYIGAFLAGLFMSIVRIAQVLSNKGILSEDNMYKKNPAIVRITMIILSIGTTLTSLVVCIVLIYTSILVKENEQYTTLLTNKVARTVSLQIYIAYSLAVLSFVAHLTNSAVACCSNGDSL